MEIPHCSLPSLLNYYKEAIYGETAASALALSVSVKAPPPFAVVESINTQQPPRKHSAHKRKAQQQEKHKGYELKGQEKERKRKGKERREEKKREDRPPGMLSGRLQLYI